MEAEIIKRWDENKHLLKKYFSETKQEEYSSYKDIVKALFKYVINDDNRLNFNIEEITEVDNGKCQGTLLFLIHLDTYQPSSSDYLITNVYYGSCSGCDTLLGISGYDEDIPTDEQVDEYMTLALHLVQKMKWIYRNE